MELSIGKWTNAMLAEWFGITEKRFKNTKSKKLKELEEYAEFYEDKGKIIITKIIYPIYVKKGSKSYEIIKDKFNKTWSNNNLDTCRRVSLAMQRDNNLGITDSTAYQYTLKVKDELYGKPLKYSGSLGSCYYCWCKQEGEGAEANFSALSPEEEKIKKSLLSKYYGSTDEKVAIVDSMVAGGELSSKDAYEMLSLLLGGDPTTRYMGFRDELQELVNAKISRVTCIEKYTTKKGKHYLDD